MEMKHFSHEHLLSLMRVEGRKRCHVCRKYNSREELAYSCTQCEVGFFLHKSCAELPQEISHPKHEEHTLIPCETRSGDYSFLSCNLCHERVRDGFICSCSLCDFDVDIQCVLWDTSLMSSIRELPHYLNHKSHQHPLIFQPRQARFLCNACGTEDKDQSYSCTKESCPFWIHKSCALLPEIMTESKHPHHPLDLAVSFPVKYLRWISKCGFCGKKIVLDYWFYWCKPCRYFFHVKCVNTDTVGQIAQDGTNSRGRQLVWVDFGTGFIILTAWHIIFLWLLWFEKIPKHGCGTRGWVICLPLLSLKFRLIFPVLVCLILLLVRFVIRQRTHVYLFLPVLIRPIILLS